MKFIQFIILILAFLVIKPAESALLIEPLVGYSMGSFQSEEGSLSSEKEKTSGLSIGGRLGFQKYGFQVGLDYLNSNLSVSDSSYDKYTTHEWAGFVGYRFPLFFRVYAGYIFSASGESKYGVGEDVQKFQKAKGSKFGLGITSFPLIDLNFELRQGSFSEYKYQGTMVEKNTDFTEYMVSISIPIVL